MMNLILALLVLVPSLTWAHELLSPVSVRSGDIRLEIEQPLHQPEVIVRVEDLRQNISEVTCTISQRIGNDTKKSDLLYTLPVLRHPNSKTYVGIYRDEKVMPHGTIVVVECMSASFARPISATVVMYYH
jgi:hypothetical protein